MAQVTVFLLEEYMPIYDYKCNECLREFEIMRSMNDESNVSCEICGSDDTKKIIKILKDSTVQIGDKSFHAPKTIIDDKVAFRKWKEIMELYKESSVEIVSSADTGLLERYCQTYSQYDLLIRARNQAIAQSSNDLQAILVISERKIDASINRLNSLLLKMDTELFLTPLSKARAVPRTKKTDPIKQDTIDKGFNL